MEAARESRSLLPPGAPPSTRCSSPRSSRTRRRSRWPRCAACAARPSRRRSTSPTRGGCCRAGWTSSAASCSAGPSTTAARWSTCCPEILSEKGRGPGARPGPAPDGAAARPGGVRVLGQRADRRASTSPSITELTDAKLEKAARALAEAESGPVRAPPRRAAGDGRAGRRARPPLPRRRGRRRRAAGRRGPALSTADAAGGVLAGQPGPGRGLAVRASSSRCTAARWSSSTPTAR